MRAAASLFAIRFVHFVPTESIIESTSVAAPVTNVWEGCRVLSLMETR